MYVYDFKFSDLSTIAYNHLLNHPEGYKVKPKFYVINFDDPRRSHRCNPIHPDFMEDITDAYESAYTIMLNLKQELGAEAGRLLCGIAHHPFRGYHLVSQNFSERQVLHVPPCHRVPEPPLRGYFPILTSYPELENYLSHRSWTRGSEGLPEQLMGQIASAKIPLSRMISPQLYWVMSDSEFTLDINNPEEPKILCVGNNPDRQNIYGAALGLYNSRIVKLINKKGMLKSSVIIDELPTIYFKGLDNLIATARSNKVAVCLGFQDFSQLVRDYGDKGGESGDEHGRQYFLRSGGGRNRQDALGTVRKGVAETAVHLHQPAGRFHLHQHADGRAYPAEQDFRAYAGNVCRFGVRQLQRAYRSRRFSTVRLSWMPRR